MVIMLSVLLSTGSPKELISFLLTIGFHLRIWHSYFMTRFIHCCHGRAERERGGPEWKGFTPEWKGFDNKSGGTTLASARALCLDRLSRVWLRISGGLNCCQESQRGVV